MATVMAMARADKSTSLVNLPFFRDVVDIASFYTFSDELATGWRCQDGNATYLLTNYLYFQVFGCANLFKLANADQFAETDQNSQRGQNASRRSACRPGGPDLHRPTQTNHNKRYKSSRRPDSLRARLVACEDQALGSRNRVDWMP
jgi:hypothetical protein